MQPSIWTLTHLAAQRLTLVECRVPQLVLKSTHTMSFASHGTSCRNCRTEIATCTAARSPPCLCFVPEYKLRISVSLWVLTAQLVSALARAPKLLQPVCIASKIALRYACQCTNRALRLPGELLPSHLREEHAGCCVLCLHCTVYYVTCCASGVIAYDPR